MTGLGVDIRLDEGGVHLGCGSSGDVWRGTADGQPAAIKVYDMNENASLWAIDEANVYESLKHLQVIILGLHTYVLHPNTSITF